MSTLFRHINRLPLILLITYHRQLGTVIDPWEAEQAGTGWFVLQNRLNWHADHDDEQEQFQHVRDIISISQSFRDAEIHRRFSRKGNSLKDFLNAIPGEILLSQIRPFIDTQIDKILRLASQHGIAVFEHEGSERVYLKNRLIISPIPAEPWFCFAKTVAGSNYVLEIFQEERKAGLKSTGNKIVCRNPCWFRNDNRLLHLPKGFDGKKIEPFLTKEVILIPASAEKKYFETFILNTLKTGQVKATGFIVQSRDSVGQMELSAESDWQGKPVLVIWFQYGEKSVMAGKSQKVFIDLKMTDDEVVFYKTERDLVWESTMKSLCLSSGLIQYNENTFIVPQAHAIGNPGMYQLVEWLNSNSLFFRHNGIRINMDRAPSNFFTGHVTAEIHVEPGEDWFDVKATVFFGDLEIRFIDLRQFILEGIREFPLPGGEIAVLPSEWFTRFGDLCYFSKAVDNHLRLQSYHGQVVRELELALTEPLSERLNLLDPDQAMKVTIPLMLHAKLRPYQEEGLRWLRFLHENRFGGILADDMGLGKTIQTLAMLLSVNEDPHAASLVVMPASLIHNWRNEIRRFAPTLRVLEHTGIQRTTVTGFFSSVDVILTTYGTLRNDLPLFLTYRFHYIILDESQVIKNPAALISKAVFQLKAEHRLVLTGTPIENSLTDLWSQMEFLNPGLLGSLAKFQKRYISQAVLPDNHNLQVTIVQSEPEAQTKVSDRLKLLLAPFILRRTKQEVEPDLPSLTIKELYCEMTEDQRTRYEQEKSAVRNEVLQQIESGRSSETTLMVLTALIRLRQIANHPKLADFEYLDGSGKFEEIIRVAQTLREEGHKILVFSSFVKHLLLVANYFDKEGITYATLTGATTQRESVIRKFQDDPECQFFLISLKAGGIGLNLTEASYVLLLDPWWNPAAEQQAINRAHRIGQDKKVIAFRFITSGTIEEKMLILQHRKQNLSDTFLPSGNPLKDLTREELAELFG